MKFGKNVYLVVSVLLFIPLVVIYFQNVTYGTFMVFLTNLNAGFSSYFWPLIMIAAGFGSALTLYIQKMLEDMDVDQQSGWFNI